MAHPVVPEVPVAPVVVMTVVVAAVMMAVMAVAVMTMTVMAAAVPAAGGSIVRRNERGDGQRGGGDDCSDDGTHFEVSPLSIRATIALT